MSHHSVHYNRRLKIIIIPKDKNFLFALVQNKTFPATEQILSVYRCISLKLHSIWYYILHVTVVCVTVFTFLGFGSFHSSRVYGSQLNVLLRCFLCAIT